MPYQTFLKKTIIIALSLFLTSYGLAYAIEATFQNDKNLWGEYVKKLEHQVKNEWVPPLGTNDKIAIFKLKVHQNGHLDAMSLYTASDDPTYDNSCGKAILRAAPFNPLPIVTSKGYVFVEFSCAQRRQPFTLKQISHYYYHRHGLK